VTRPALTLEGVLLLALGGVAGFIIALGKAGNRHGSWIYFVSGD
jgi:hypothetical protein